MIPVATARLCIGHSPVQIGTHFRNTAASTATVGGVTHKTTALGHVHGTHPTCATKAFFFVGRQPLVVGVQTNGSDKSGAGNHKCCR